MEKLKIPKSFIVFGLGFGVKNFQVNKICYMNATASVLLNNQITFFKTVTVSSKSI